MASLPVEMLLFQPASNVVFGMLAVVASNAKKLLRLLVARESSDMDRLLLAGLVGDPARLILHSVFMDGGAAKYASAFATSTYGVHFAHSTAGIDAMTPGYHRVSNEFPRAWLADRHCRVVPIAAANPGAMAAQAGYWFPCDGIVVFDLSMAPRKPVSDGMVAPLQALSLFDPVVVDGFESALIERLMQQPLLIAALRDRADGIVLLHIVVDMAGVANETCTTITIDWRKHSRSMHRREGFHEATLQLSAEQYFGDEMS